jgi:AmmeMemoRadiSam system protein A
MMFTEAEKHLLRILVQNALEHAVHHGSALSVILSDFPENLRAPGASFVTLMLNDELRGCIGHLEAFQPLVKDIADNAYAAALKDPRFSPVAKTDLLIISVQISVLSKPEPLACTSEADLLSKIRPGIDGLILEDGHRRATFLPAVWENLPEPQEFVRQLKRKAGLEQNGWSETLTVQRYTAAKI